MPRVESVGQAERLGDSRTQDRDSLTMHTNTSHLDIIHRSMCIPRLTNFKALCTRSTLWPPCWLLHFSTEKSREGESSTSNVHRGIGSVIFPSLFLLFSDMGGINLSPPFICHLFFPPPIYLSLPPSLPPSLLLLPLTSPKHPFP